MTVEISDAATLDLARYIGPGAMVAWGQGWIRCSRADAGVIVTEYGVADLRGLSLARRRERMIAIAHPDHRAALDRMEDKT